MFARLSVRISILLPCNARSHHFNGWVRAHETSLTLTLFIEVPVPSQESEWSVFVLGVSILPLSTVLIYMYLILEMLQKCSIFINIIQLDMNSCVNESK
jgi:hypothetical protein